VRIYRTEVTGRRQFVGKVATSDLVAPPRKLACLSKVKRGTALAIVFGWWAVFTLTVAALGAAFS
jgi:hypothetical protein